jgi:hypothetical protein
MWIVSPKAVRAPNRGDPARIVAVPGAPVEGGGAARNGGFKFFGVGLFVLLGSRQNREV